MEDKELLAAIEALLDKKLDEKLEPIVERLDTLEESMDELRSGVNTLLKWSEGVGEKFSMPLRPAQ